MSEEIKINEDINVCNLTVEKLSAVKVLYTANLSVMYQATFYRTLVENPDSFTKLAYRNDKLIGAISCRINRSDSSLYILTIAVMPLERGKQIGSRLLNSIIDEVVVNNGIKFIHLHVQEGSQALSFYQKQGFKIEEEIPHYYKRILPHTAYRMLRSFE